MNRQYHTLFREDEEDFILPPPRRQFRVLRAPVVRALVGYDQAIVPCVREMRGIYEILGISGFNVYVGVNALPDLASPPVFTATLPYQVATTPPGMGTKTYNVIVRAVNAYGLESQNQYAYSFVIDTSGTLVATIKPAPINLLVTLATTGGIGVRAMWPPFSKAVTATWRLWVKATPPDVGVDTVTQTAAATSQALSPMITGTLAPGLWHIALGVYSEGALSEVARTTITVPVDLDGPVLLP